MSAVSSWRMSLTTIPLAAAVREMGLCKASPQTSPQTPLSFACCAKKCIFEGIPLTLGMLGLLLLFQTAAPQACLAVLQVCRQANRMATEHLLY